MDKEEENSQILYLNKSFFNIISNMEFDSQITLAWFRPLFKQFCAQTPL